MTFLNSTPRAVSDESITTSQGDQWDKSFRLSEKMNIPTRHESKKLDDLTGDEWKAKYSDIAGKLGQGFILALIGTRGTGKTQMAVSLINHSVWYRAKSARFALAMDFFIKIKATYHRKDSEMSEDDVIGEFCRPSLLVLDEIQERGESQWEDRLLTHVINKRYNDMKDTLLLSNLSAQEFKASIGSSIASRLNETGGIILCNWESFRK